MDLTFFAGFDKVTTAAVPGDHDARLYGVAGFFDALKGYVEVGYGYLDADVNDLSYHNVTAAFSRRYGGLVSNSVRLIGNFGQSAAVKTADGLLVLVENSLITSKPLTLVPYLNLFAGFDSPQSLARAAGTGGVLTNTGIDFETDGLTGYPTLDASGHDPMAGRWEWSTCSTSTARSSSRGRRSSAWAPTCWGRSTPSGSAINSRSRTPGSCASTPCTVGGRAGRTSSGRGSRSVASSEPRERSKEERRMSIIQLNVNGTLRNVDVDGNMPLLWVLRDVLGLKGTKFGCGVAQCGACTVHLDGRAARSCITDVGVAALSRITTIEGLSADGSHPGSRRGSNWACRSAGTASRGRS